MDEAVRAQSSPKSSRTGGFPAHAAPCKINPLSSSFNSCKAKVLLTFSECEGPDPAPKDGQVSFDPRLTLELMRRYRCLEDVNHLLCFGMG